MNSELITKLKERKEKLENNIQELANEYTELTSLTHETSRKDNARIKTIKKEISPIKKEIEEITEDIEDITALEERANKLKAMIDHTEDEEIKSELKESLEEVTARSISESIALEEKYAYILEEKEETKEDLPEEEKEELLEEKTNKKKTSKKDLIKNGAICALALALTISLLKGCDSKKNTNDDKTNDTTITETQDKEQTPTILDEIETEKIQEETKEELKFTDINDSEQVSERANEIIEFLDTNNEGHDYTIEEIENIMKWINGGIVEEAGHEEALFAVSRVEVLMNRENQKEVENIFDVSKLFLDGTQGQKLASEIYNSRVEIQNTKGTETARQSQEKFAELFINSWTLNGNNNVTSAYALETSGMEALIDTYFINTYAMTDEENIKVTVSGVEFSLNEAVDKANEANCPTVVTADNGETFETYMNKFSSDMIGMVTEATINKENNNSLILTK